MLSSFDPKPSTRSCAILVGSPGGKLRTLDGGRLRCGAHRQARFQEAFVRNLGPTYASRRRWRRVRFLHTSLHAATSDGVEDALRWWPRPQDRIVRNHCHSKAEFERRMGCTTGSAWCSILRTVCPSKDSSAASADASYLAASIAETQHGES